MLYGTHRIGRAPDGILRQIGCMRIAGCFARHGAQAESLGGVEAGGLQPAVVETERLALAVFQKELAVVGVLQRLMDHVLNTLPVEAGRTEKQVVFRHVGFSACIVPLHNALSAKFPHACGSGANARVIRSQ